MNLDKDHSLHPLRGVSCHLFSADLFLLFFLFFNNRLKCATNPESVRKNGKDCEKVSFTVERTSDNLQLIGILCLMIYVLTDISEDLKNVLECMLNPDDNMRPSADQLLHHPLVGSRRRRRCLRLGLRKARWSIQCNVMYLVSCLFQLFLLIFIPIRTLARKWRKTDYVQPSTPIRSALCTYANDFSFSDGIHQPSSLIPFFFKSKFKIQISF